MDALTGVLTRAHSAPSAGGAAIVHQIKRRGTITAEADQEDVCSPSDLEGLVFYCELLNGPEWNICILEYLNLASKHDRKTESWN